MGGWLHNVPDSITDPMNILDNLPLLCRPHTHRIYQSLSDCQPLSMLLINNHQELPGLKVPTDASDSRSHNVRTSNNMGNRPHINSNGRKQIQAPMINKHRDDLRVSLYCESLSIGEHDFTTLDQLNLDSRFV